MSSDLYTEDDCNLIGDYGHPFIKGTNEDSMDAETNSMTTNSEMEKIEWKGTSKFLGGSYVENMVFQAQQKQELSTPYRLDHSIRQQLWSMAVKESFKMKRYPQEHTFREFSVITCMPDHPITLLRLIALKHREYLLVVTGRHMSLYDLWTGTPLYHKAVHRLPITDVIYFAEQQWIVTTSRDSDINVFHVETAEQLYSFHKHKGDVTKLLKLNERFFISTTDLDNPLIWDTTKWKAPPAVLMRSFHCKDRLNDIVCIQHEPTIKLAIPEKYRMVSYEFKPELQAQTVEGMDKIVPLKDSHILVSLIKLNANYHLTLNSNLTLVVWESNTMDAVGTFRVDKNMENTLESMHATRLLKTQMMHNKSRPMMFLIHQVYVFIILGSSMLFVDLSSWHLKAEGSQTVNVPSRLLKASELFSASEDGRYAKITSLTTVHKELVLVIGNDMGHIHFFFVHSLINPLEVVSRMSSPLQLHSKSITQLLTIDDCSFVSTSLDGSVIIHRDGLAQQCLRNIYTTQQQRIFV
mmetsp:Transcript_6676/g.9686  ORF Transcript_6676/g.9686 Transcript_6676/m.9686 type:complete len:522 (-) Transcript_6676:2-1567(-)